MRAGAAFCATFWNSGGGVCVGGVAVVCTTEADGVAVALGTVAGGGALGVTVGVVSKTPVCGGGFRPHHE